ncbi:hypothetical protein EIN_267950 [Entamoeba invadens IP1]|uniref:Uncharacterized protein n=1 Tax=Entamoeba invadens IP1 TaxID=370355 RepID=A0A0A1U803_ENTIV|nr:hypothetical protein EIN_267950 [Entamoeba invadens IP1]ELP91059.1 hypothetical protein EIN_267950 [Entamoeba invadens IP1]|eukprot:XP_004257830.1 hypothetical protein EIN_267950 [Entamoeba invadens IP1]
MEYARGTLTIMSAFTQRSLKLTVLGNGMISYEYDESDASANLDTYSNSREIKKEEKSISPLSEKKKSKDANERYIFGFRVSRNYQAEQQAILLALINKTYSITVEHPLKKSKLTIPFLKIIQFTSDDSQPVYFNNIVEQQIKVLQNEDLKNGVTQKTVNRRKDVHRITEVIRLLISFARDMGFDIKTKKTSGSKGSVKESIKEIHFNNVVLTKQTISEIGRNISNEMEKKMANANTDLPFCFGKQDKEIAQLFKIL